MTIDLGSAIRAAVRARLIAAGRPDLADSFTLGFDIEGSPQSDLEAKLARVSELEARASTEGERQAAAAAAGRIRARLAALKGGE